MCQYNFTDLSSWLVIKSMLERLKHWLENYCPKRTQMPPECTKSPLNSKYFLGEHGLRLSLNVGIQAPPGPQLETSRSAPVRLFTCIRKPGVWKGSGKAWCLKGANFRWQNSLLVALADGTGERGNVRKQLLLCRCQRVLKRREGSDRVPGTCLLSLKSHIF